jgi:uncharacterized protein YceH (UPF0502 family)
MSTTGNESSTVKWQPLNPRQRRVAGVLIEKAKTVPDSYPMTLNGIITGCNQKSNRDPQMDLSEDEVQEVLEELKRMGVVIEVITTGSRVPKYKHNLYDWLGVDKVEIAVMTELLLRGEQTLGELRARAARMEPIPDLGTLQTIFQSLLAKKLVRELTPPGRGQLVSHNLYKDRELPELQAAATRHSAAHPQAASSGSGSGGSAGSFATESDSPSWRSGVGGPPASGAGTASIAGAAAAARPGVTLDMFAELRLEVAELRAEVARLRSLLSELSGSASGAGTDDV